ncbi:O-methyltransferase [Galactobacillus timonensis]|uniref:O-methyltransferase n=1 Tax=Galactobacillus timonensis TaxID=2041840 RepID=UPI001FD8E21A|nr:class I SAM-dependent methyltransferase [Galactobacillus timonensis]
MRVDLKKLEDEARRKDIPLMFDDGMNYLCDYLNFHPEVMRILEAGTAVGWSSMKMASVRDNITIDTIEIDEERYQAAKKNIAAAGLDDRIFCWNMDALDYATVKYYDLFFIDAAKSQYARMVRHFLAFSYVGSVFVFDNLNFHGIVDDPSLSNNRSTLQMTRKIAKFRDWLAGNDAFATEFHPEIGDGIAFAKRVK